MTNTWDKDKYERAVKGAIIYQLKRAYALFFIPKIKRKGALKCIINKPVYLEFYLHSVEKSQ